MSDEIGDRYRHKARGTQYVIVGSAELQAAEPVEEGAILTVYRGDDGKLWARRAREFGDGRFERLDTPPMTTPQGLAAQIEALALIRRRSIQAIGAGISTRNWHTVEAAYNEARDGFDKMLRELPAIVAAIRQGEDMAGKQPELAEAQEIIRDALLDSNYLAGAKAGWNAAQADDPNAAYAVLVTSFQGHLAGYAQAKAIVSAAPPPAPDERDDEVRRLREALEDLISWFPEKPSQPEWRLPAGEFGANDAVAAARAALSPAKGGE